ncbi:CsbD family protein [Stakelama marina]|uniref:CsbD family protein n=1 Tax=Stakelama marina TaxID=2826939 RepID=A0A8T4IAW0_9SPHN|nr:CsbD family protein [Stakelama marina]MBR0552158.1 CsbD family protein [Stakelama marina]
MGELKDKVKGNLNEAAGKIKQQSDNPETREEGAEQEGKGKAQQFSGKVKGALGDDI